MNLLIVDDEPVARAELTRMLEEFVPNCSTREAGTVAEARSSLLESRFHGLFLDLRMPDDHGMTLLPDANASRTPVVITTAHEEHAIDAIDQGVHAYLLKPIEPDRLYRALIRLKARDGSMGSDFVLVGDQHHYWPVEPCRVTMVEAEGSYSSIRTDQGDRMTLSRNLKEVERQLGSPDFVRANRSQLINIRHVKVFMKDAAGGLVADLGEHGRVVFSRRQARAFRSRWP